MKKLFKFYLLLLIPVLSILAVSCDDEVVEIPEPTITSVSPNEALPGAGVTITGTNLADASSVTFGGVAASSFDANATSITVTVPATTPTGSQNIAVTTPGGTATTTFTVLEEEEPEPDLTPTVTGVDPVSAAVGDEIVITGTNFENLETVSFGGDVEVAAADVTEATATSITLNVPEGAHTGVITITTAEGTAESAEFTVTEAAAEPTITSVEPATGAVGSEVTITGENLGELESVMFGDVAATVDTEASNETTIVFTVPEGAVTGPITVTTAGGTVDTEEFIVTEAAAEPTITSVDPMTGEVGDVVVITGTDLDNLHSVMIGEIEADVDAEASTATSISFTVPAGAASAPVTVITSGGTVSTTENFTVTVADDATALVLFDETVNEAWQIWDGWGHSLLEWDNTEQANTGTTSAKVTFNAGAWGGIQLHPAEAFTTEGHESVVLSVYGAEGTGNVMLYIKEEGQADADIKKVTLDVVEGQWNTYVVPLSLLGSVETGAAATISELVVQDVGNTGGDTDNTYYIDDIQLR